MTDLETVYQPGISREALARLAGCSEWKARQFLFSKQLNEPFPDVSPIELDLIRKGLVGPPPTTPIRHEWSKDSFKFAFITDTHNGHQLSHQEWWDKTCSLVEREKVAVCFHAGDITEGMSGRPGHVYELEAIGAHAQTVLTERRLRQMPCPIQAITGNHDLWGYKAIGFDPGEALSTSVPGFTYLGQNEATVDVGSIKIMLWHGGDGSSYATSYRTQKFVEGLTGGEKPHILLSGHAHKSIYHQCRNVAVFEGGTLCGQTGWMRGKKLSAHVGFWIIEVWPNETGIERIRSEWIPFYQ